MRKFKTLGTLREIPDPFNVADEIERNGMAEAAAKIRANGNCIELVEMQLDSACEILERHRNEP